jgi:hypothetical protein
MILIYQKLDVSRELEKSNCYDPDLTLQSVDLLCLFSLPLIGLVESVSPQSHIPSPQKNLLKSLEHQNKEHSSTNIVAVLLSIRQLLAINKSTATLLGREYLPRTLELYRQENNPMELVRVIFTASPKLC